MKLGLVALVLGAIAGFAGPAVTLIDVLEKSNIVVVATVESLTVLPAGSNLTSKPSVPAPLRDAPWYPCKARLKVDYVIQGGGAPRVFDVLIYALRNDCHLVYYPENAPLRQALWFLRSEGGWYRPAMDADIGFRQLYSFPEHLPAKLDSLSDAAMRIGYVLLAPGIAQPFDQRFRLRAAGSHGSNRMEHYIRLLREIYLDYGAEVKEAVARKASEYFMCLARTKTNRIDNETIAEFDERMTGYLDRYEMQLRGQIPASERAGLRDDLEWFSCSSTKTLRAKSRELLERHFYIRPERIVCIPCE